MDRNIRALARILVAPLAPHRLAYAAADEDFAGYPKDNVLAILEDRASAAAALAEARDAGISSDEITVYSGDEGAEAIDARGTQHGMTGFVQRSIEFLSANQDNLKSYQEAVERGGVVVAVHADNDERKHQVAALLQRHGAHDVRHFGGFVVQDLDADPSRTRAD